MLKNESCPIILRCDVDRGTHFTRTMAPGTHPSLPLISGGKENLGFLFLYELLTESLKLKITDEDISYNWGCILLRLLPAKETRETGHIMSILRMLCVNRSLALQMPKFKDDRKFKTEVLPILDSSQCPFSGKVTW